MRYKTARPALDRLALAMLAAVSAATPLAAQGLGPGGPGASGGESGMFGAEGEAPGPGSVSRRDNDAPVISAPDDPGRAQPPAAEQFGGLETGGYNNFAAGDMAPVPPLDGFSPPALPVVVELFTSQGCSSCPSADAMLAQLADQPGVLPLSFHVDYWDYLGWADSFARPEFSARQEAYARAAGERAIYTPQLIVEGQDTAVAPGPAQLSALIEAHRVAPAMVNVQRTVTPEGDRIEILPLSDLGGPVSVQLVRYAPKRTVEIAEGENRGRAIDYTNVVLSMTHLTDWDGLAPLRLTVRTEGQPDDSFPADTRHVLLVQAELGRKELPGPILAAINLD